ncbi:MAG: hypothetical protein HYU36_11565 [Planctomycetes bacterium]|nr:hypothetical protein [Planctomycetota bacterium]
MASRSLNLWTQVSYPEGLLVECRHDLHPILAAESEVELIDLRMPRGEPAASPVSAFPAGSEVKTDVRLPGTLFLRAALPAPPGVSWRRTLMARRGLFLAVLDEVDRPGHGQAGRRDVWDSSTLIGQVNSFDAAPGGGDSSLHLQIALLPRMAILKPQVGFVQGRFIRLARLRHGLLAGLGRRQGFTELRQVRFQAQAFWIDQDGFALLETTRVDVCGRKLLEADQPVTMEWNFETGTGTVEGRGDSKLVLHGGNVPHEIQVTNGRTDVEITGLARKGEWWNAVMAAVQRL